MKRRTRIVNGNGNSYSKLEDRKLLASLSNGILFVPGTNSDDTIQIDPSGDMIDVTVNGSVESFLASAVTDKIDIRGYDGNDTISNNTSLPSTIRGAGGDDIINGGSGQDFMYGGLGVDEFHGGDGNDWIYSGGMFVGNNGPVGGELVYGDAGNDTIRIQPDTKGSDDEHGATVYGGDGNDRIYGIPSKEGDLSPQIGGDDTFFGGDGDDFIRGQTGRDRIFGGNGNDRIFGGDGIDTLEGGLGDDEIYTELGQGNGYTDQETAFGDTSIDTASNTATIEIEALYHDLSTGDIVEIWGVKGNDAANGRHTITVTDQHHFELQGATGSGTYTVGGEYALVDPITNEPGGGNDQVYGGDGLQFLYGGAGDDTIRDDGTGADQLFGGFGDDNVVSASQGDKLFGGEGNDTMRLLDSSFYTGVTALIEGGNGNDHYLVRYTFDPNATTDIIRLTELDLQGNFDRVSIVGDTPTTIEWAGTNDEEIWVDGEAIKIVLNTFDDFELFPAGIV